MCTLALGCEQEWRSVNVVGSINVVRSINVAGKQFFKQYHLSFGELVGEEGSWHLNL